MTRTQIERFREVLQGKREELAEEVRSWGGLLEVKSVGDRMDQARLMAEKHAAVQNMAHKSALLQLVEGACQRIEEGTFGMCGICGAEIPRKRLEIIPWARYCVACQQSAERRREAPADARSPDTLAS